MKLNYPLVAVCCIAAFCSGKATAQQNEFCAKTDSVYQALMQRSSSLLLPLLDDSCSIGNLPRGINPQLIPAILEKFPALTGYRWLKVETDSTGTLVSMELLYQTGKTGNPTYHVNAKGKIDQLNIIKNASVAGGGARPAARLLDAPDTLRVPFAFRSGLIYIKATLDGREGWFLLDTGSPEMILNRQYFSDSLLPLPGDAGYTGINGRIQDVMMRRMRRLQLGAFTLQNFGAMVMLGQEEDYEDGLPVLGSIGYNTIRDFEVCFQMQQRNLLLIKTDSAGNYTAAGLQQAPVLYTAPFEMRRHIPVVIMTVGEQQLRMGIDCGAANNVLFAAKKEAVMPFMEQWEKVSMTGQEGVSIPVERAYLKQSKIGMLTLGRMLTVVTGNNMDYKAAVDKTALDGLLGTEFLQLYTTSLNFRKKQVYFR